MMNVASRAEISYEARLIPQDPMLVLLRVLMRKCRAKSRVDVFETCATLWCDPRKKAQDYADALLRVLNSALRNGLTIHTVTARERSFDENWLLALFASIARADDNSVAFLLRARLPRHLRRPVGWLASELVECMSATPNRKHRI